MKRDIKKVNNLVNVAIRERENALDLLPDDDIDEEVAEKAVYLAKNLENFAMHELLKMAL